MRGRLSDKARLQHILDAILEIKSFVHGCDRNEFESNSMMRFACIKLLEIIGEAAKHMSAETKNSFPKIEWNRIAGMRNVFVHEYFGIDTKVVWDIIVQDIPELKSNVEEILTSFK